MAFGTRTFDDVQDSQDFGASSTSVPGELAPDLMQRIKELDSQMSSLSARIKASSGKEKENFQASLSDLVSEKEDILQGKVKSSMKPASPELGEPSVGGQPPNLDLMVGKEGPKTLAMSLSDTAKPAKSLKESVSAAPDYFQQAQTMREAGEGSLQGKLAQAETTRKEARERADIGQAAEMFGKALTQYGAARAGMKSGRDLSQAVAGTPGVDWEARRKEIQEDYKLRQTDVENERRLLETKAEALEKRGQYEDSKSARKEAMGLEKQKFAWQQLQDLEQNRLKGLETDVKLAALAGDKNKVSLELSKRYRDDDVTKRTVQLRQNTQAAEDLYQKQLNSKTRSSANDIALIFNFVRAQDPASTVREGEYSLAGKQGGLYDLYRSYVQKLEDGTLDDKVRSYMINTIRTQASAQEKMQKRADEDYQVMGTKLGADLDVIFGKRTNQAGQQQLQPADTSGRKGTGGSMPGSQLPDLKK